MRRAQLISPGQTGMTFWCSELMGNATPTQGEVFSLRRG